eukprot:scaffold1999_cov153-Amphora_coffeaeformis.AAC.1
MARTKKKRNGKLPPNCKQENQGDSSLKRAEKGEKPGVPRRKERTKHTIENPKTIAVSMLQCKRVHSNETRVLVWETHEQTQTRKASEEKVLPLLYKGKEEYGLSRQFSRSRKEQIRKVCHEAGIPLLQALSLRRSYMRVANRGRSMPHMGLGSYKNIQAAASLFEDALIDFLRRKRIPFYSEQEQRDYSRAQSNGSGPSPPTPDILLREEIKVRMQHDAFGKDH